MLLQEKIQSPISPLEKVRLLNGGTAYLIYHMTGKTLIAVMVLDAFLRKYPLLKVMFIVPTRALVVQQSAYIRANSALQDLGTPVCVGELSGQITESWGMFEWTEAMQKYNVVVGTPEVFRIGFVDRGYIHPANFSLIVFDECHNATGNSPMAAIMMDAVSKYFEAQDIHGAPTLPRILGLTASFVSGALGSTSAIEKKREVLCNLLSAKMVSPDVTEYAVDDKTYHQVMVPDEEIPPEIFKDEVNTIVKLVLEAAPGNLISRRDMNKWITKGYTIFSEMGAAGFKYWLREGIFLQLQGKAQHLLAQSSDQMCMNIGRSMQSALNNMDKLYFPMALGESITMPPFLAPF
jgi:ERCC4-related helicase